MKRYDTEYSSPKQAKKGKLCKGGVDTAGGYVVNVDYLLSIK